jgi:hypothetical protein
MTSTNCVACSTYNAREGLSGDGRTLNEADEIAHGLHLIDIIIRDLDASNSIFDHNRKFEAIEPVSPQIMNEMRLIGHMLAFNAEIVCNEPADNLRSEALKRSCSTPRRSRAAHKDAPLIRFAPASNHAASLQLWPDAAASADYDAKVIMRRLPDGAASCAPAMTLRRKDRRRKGCRDTMSFAPLSRIVRFPVYPE